MKNQFATCFVLLVLVFTSCSKTEFENSPQLSKPALIVKSEKSYQIQQLMYNSLTTQEMKTLWVSHLNYCLSTYTLTPGQINAVNQGITLLNNNILDNLSDPAFEIWRAASTIEFPELKKQYMVFGTLSEYTNQEFLNPDPTPYVPNGGGSSGSGGADGCKCSLLAGHDFCGVMNSSTVGVGSFVYECDSKISCTKSYKGCGWFWWQDCDGLCKQFFFPSGGHT